MFCEEFGESLLLFFGIFHKVAAVDQANGDQRDKNKQTDELVHFSDYCESIILLRAFIQHFKSVSPITEKQD